MLLTVPHERWVAFATYFILIPAVYHLEKKKKKGLSFIVENSEWIHHDESKYKKTSLKIPFRTKKFIVVLSSNFILYHHSHQIFRNI